MPPWIRDREESVTDAESTVPVRYYFLAMLGTAGLAPSVIWSIVGGNAPLALGVGAPFALLLAWAGYRLVHG